MTRAHRPIPAWLSAVDLPIVGDELYKPRGRAQSKAPAGAPPMTRHALHARALELAHPATGETLKLEAPLPADLADLIAFLRK